MPQLRSTDGVQFVVCIGGHADVDVLLVKPAPISVPPLARRTDEPSRIIGEYAADANAALGALHPGFADADRAWLLEHAATSLAEIEEDSLRLVAIRTCRNMSDAAARLGMAPVSLSRWLGRRKLPAT